MLSTLIIEFYKSLLFFNSHYGHKSISLTKKKGVHPLSSSLILGSKNNCPIIDPTKTLKAFIKSLYILQVFSKRFNTFESSSIKNSCLRPLYFEKSKSQQRERQKIEIENRFLIKDRRNKKEKRKIQKGFYLEKISTSNTINKALQENNLLPSFFTTLALNPFFLGEIRASSSCEKEESSISSTLLFSRGKQFSKKTCKFVRSDLPNLLLNQKICVVNDLEKEEKIFLKSNFNLLVVNTNPDFSILVRNLFQSTSLKGCSLAYCNEKWVGGLLTNWKQVFKSIEVFGRFSNKFGDFLNKNRVYSPRFKKLHRDFQGFLFKRNYLETGMWNPNSKENPIQTGKLQISRYSKKNPLFSDSKTKTTFLSSFCSADILRNQNIRNGSKSSPSTKNKKNKHPFTFSKPLEREKAKSSIFPFSPSEKMGVGQEVVSLLNQGFYKLPFKRKPDLIILINSNDNKDLVQEANNLNIPIIGIINSNTKPLGITYPVPGNSNSIHFVYFFLKWVIRVLNNPDLLSLKEKENRL